MTSIAPEKRVFPERRNAAGEPLRLLDEIRDLHQHRDLVHALVHRDLTARYKRSVLGFFWTMLHPLLLMLIFFIVFANIFRFQTPFYPVYFLSQYIAWTFFSQTTVNSMTSIAWNGLLMKRVRVPKSVFTLSAIFSGIVNMLLALVLLLGIMLIIGAPVRPALLFLPVSLLIVGVFTLGASLALSPISVFFGDVREMYQAAIPALMYLTPVIYPIEIVPERFRWIVELNPLMHVLQVVRDPIYNGILPSARTLGLACTFAALSFVIGWAIFRRLAPRLHAHL